MLSRRCPAGCSCCPDHVVSSVVRAVPIIVVSPAALVVQIMLSCRLLVLSRRCSAGCSWCADHVIESVAGVVPPGWFIVSPAAHVDDAVGCRRLMLSRSCCQIMLSVGVLHARHRGSSQPLCVGIVLSSRTRTWPSYRSCLANRGSRVVWGDRPAMSAGARTPRTPPRKPNAPGSASAQARDSDAAQAPGSASAALGQTRLRERGPSPYRGSRKEKCKGCAIAAGPPSPLVFN